jgi:3-isopropylmalate dehydrogenase
MLQQTQAQHETLAGIRSLNIAVLPGDGIGGDVVEAARQVWLVLESSAPGTRLNWRNHPAGAAEFLQNGDPLPDSTMEACRQADAIFLGAMGLPKVRWPDGREMAPQIDLRERLDTYAGLRPVRLFHADHTPLRGYRAGEIDFVLVRESTEGLFASRLDPRDPNSGTVRDTMRITRAGADRVCRAAFQVAEGRRGHLTLVDKANVLPSMAFFRERFDIVAAEFPQVQTDRIYVDAAALYLVQNPRRFDVLVTENMFGDILSDLAAGLVGGMGLAPSADIGDRHAIFQPAHGSAPDIAGRGVANPIATILSLAMMLEWLKGDDLLRCAARIRSAVERVLADPANKTADLGGSLSTEAMAAAVIGEL